MLNVVVKDISPSSRQPQAKAQTPNPQFVRQVLMAGFAFVVMLALTMTQALARPDSFADLAERLSPAVVNISTTTIVKTRDNMEVPQFPPGSPFEEFFKDFGDRNQTRRAQSLGSGFIVDAAGIVVTNNHVVENAEEITISLSNETTYKAEIIGRDAKTDIAVLKFDPEGANITAVSFGDSDNLRVGDWVLAIGNPFGLGGTVTAGIVSARGRDIGSGPYDDYIQTDASINRGNSGGPLFDMDGAVIGINTAIFSQTGGSVGIGFAISSNLANQVVDQLVEYGRTRRGWLGVFIQEVTEDIAESLGLDKAAGALVSNVTEGGPAEQSGIEAGDVIISFDGKEIERMRDLPRIVAETDVDKEVKVILMRNGKEMMLDVRLGELEQAENGGLLSGEPTKQDSKSFGDLGFSVEQLTADLASEYGLEENTEAVIVTEVIAGSPAAEKGLQAGDVIARFGQNRITSIEELSKGIDDAREAGRSGILMLVQRDGQNRFVQISFLKKDE
ncbi:MAG: DegQ family serine endoprotease [Candidatus Puniceispirillaceae bacterium]